MQLIAVVRTEPSKNNHETSQTSLVFPRSQRSQFLSDSVHFQIQSRNQLNDGTESLAAERVGHNIEINFSIENRDIYENEAF